MSGSPLLESTKYYVLLALASGPMHGAAVQDQISGDTLGVYVRDSTLYAALKSLARDGLVEGPLGAGVSPVPLYRKIYTITEAGKRRLELESRTLRRATQLAQGRLGYRR